jgi:hypothetical protein
LGLDQGVHVQLDFGSNATRERYRNMTAAR